MEADKFIHTIDITYDSITLKVDNVAVYTAKVKTHLFSETYTIAEDVTGKKYKLKIFKGDKIELYNQEMEPVLDLNYHIAYHWLEPDVSIINTANNIFLTGKPQGLVYSDTEVTDISGYYEHLATTSDFTYKFSSPKNINNPFHLIICCFCYKALVRPHT
ncbi:hypothetical protein ACFGVR_22265 [Mucilaginibacter sp. AW1-3]